MSWRAAARLAVACALAWLGPAVPATAGVPIDSTSGSGAFGRWAVDGAGLPMYRYTLDQARAPFARQPELLGRTDAWHQLGNERAIAAASNDGQVQLWSQDRRYEWVNRYDPAALQLAGGFGWLRSGRTAFSTRYADRPAGSRTRRELGLGYVRRTIAAAGFRVDERVHAPLGAGPVLVHDVTIVNATRRTRSGSWFEYWAANPFDQAEKRPIGLDRPRTGAGGRLLTVGQRPSAADRRPLTIFAAALDGPVAGRATDGARFFGAGGARLPDAVAAGRLDPAVAPDARTTHDARLPARLAPAARRAGHAALRLRHRPCARDPRPRRRPPRGPARVRALAGRLGAVGAPDPARPRARLALARAAVVGLHAALGRLLRGVPRAADPVPGRLLPVRPRVPGRVPRPAAARPSVDLRLAGDRPGRAAVLGLRAAAARRAGALRDELAVPAQRCPGRRERHGPLAAVDGGGVRAGDARHRHPGRAGAVRRRRARVAVGAPRARLRPPGVAARAARRLPHPRRRRLVGLLDRVPADDRVDARVGPARVRVPARRAARGPPWRPSVRRAPARAGTRALATTRREWTPRGWYSRGYGGDRQIGTGAIFGEPQPWALLAGAASPARRARSSPTCGAS